MHDVVMTGALERTAVGFELEACGPMDGRIVVVTGGTSGIGYETARALSAAGATWSSCLATERTLAAAERITSLTGRAHSGVADFCELARFVPSPPSCSSASRTSTCW